jgi:hypothetical protein
MLEQQVLLATTTTTTTTTNEGLATPNQTGIEPAPEPQRVENIHRPKARLPDPVLFGGNIGD